MSGIVRMLRAPDYYNGLEVLIAFDSVESVQEISTTVPIKVTTKSGDRFELAITMREYLQRLTASVESDSGLD